MKSVKEIMAGDLVSPWRGSEQTASDVRKQLEARLGRDVAASFDPRKDMMPFGSWAAYGFRVKRGERSFKSITFIDLEGDDGRVIKKIRRVVHLFHKFQVEKI